MVEMPKGTASWSFCAGPAAAYGMIPLVAAPTLPPSAAPARAAAPPVAVPVEPEDPVARLALTCLREGRAAVAEKRLPEALAWFERSLALQPDMRIAQFCRAMVLADLDRPEDAYVALEASLGRDGDDAPARIQYARLLARHGHYDASIRLLGPAIVAKPHLAPRIAEDADFRALRDHPFFLQMVGAL